MEETWDPTDDRETIRRKAAAASMPLPGLLDALLARIADGLMEHMTAAGFDDLRNAHNAVFGNVPAEGIRLTELAAKARISKQAMAELVDDLEAKGYVERQPDPTDGRAKLIFFSGRGWDSLPHARGYFDELESRLGEIVGEREMAAVRTTLERLVAASR